jgi:hypothetical protein
MPEQRRSRIERAEANEEEKSNQHQAERKPEVTLDNVCVEIPDAPRLMRSQADESASEKQLMKLVAQTARKPREIRERGR